MCHDLLGFEDRVRPKFVRRYADLAARRDRARSSGSPPTCAPGAFPSSDETYHMTDTVAEALGLYGAVERERARRA